MRPLPRSFPLPALLLLAGCQLAGPRAAHLAAPVPLRAQAGAPPRRVISSAAEQLRAEGFLITALDTAGRLRAEREHRPGELDATLSCRAVAGAAARTGASPTMIIDLAATPRAGGGSELVVSSRVRTTYLRLTAEPARATSDDDCRSTGVVERQLAERLAAPAP